jgi:hypothetical protein
VEAELVDVRDGKVILKRTDGTQITVPLNQLSLGDVRYVQEVLAEAEAQAVGATTRPAAGGAGGASSSESWESPAGDSGRSDPDDVADESEDAGGWGTQTELAVGDPDEVAFGPPGCPVVLAGEQIWVIAQGKIHAQLEAPRERRSLATISPDGRWIATADKSPNQQETPVTVWDATTGRRRFTVPGHPERFADLIVLSNDHLFLGGRQDGELLIWDLHTGQEEKTLKLPDNLRSGKVGFTQDGKYLATPDDDRMVVINVDTGRVVATMSPPKAMEHSRGPQAGEGPGSSRMPGRRTTSGPRRATSSDATFIYAWIQSVKFSPDGKELAVISTHPDPRLICWNSRGTLIYDEPFYDDGRAFWENTLKWFPDRSAWLIANDIFDRESGRIVFSIKEGFAQDLAIHVLDDNHLIGTFPHNPSQVEVLPIPWKDIRASLALMKEKGAALLSPADPVGLKIELGALRGNQEETTAVLRGALETRLARDGLRLAEDRPAFFRLKFAETAGDVLPIHERQSMFDRRGRDTGRTATEAKGTLVLELMVPDRDEPVWRDTLRAASSRSFDEEINDATVRKSMIQNLTRVLNKLKIPYFIPKSDEVLALPVVLDG